MLADHLLETWQVACRGNDVDAFKLSILNNLEYRLAKGPLHATKYDRFMSVAYAAAERMIERWILTQETYYQVKPKRVYYLSMEFLMGRSLGNTLINLELYDTCKQALEELGYDLEEMRDFEVDAGLGNGGLGRLAACFLDSMATMGIPAHGYGIRYNYGLFKQKIVDGRQVETPDHWLALPNPWEVARPEHVFKVRFGGRVEHQTERDGTVRAYWRDADEVLAQAYDTPIPGYQASNVNTLRLWSAGSSDDFNLDCFNHGDYIAACQKQVRSENITKVLYPNDAFYTGKELRLKQEYFLTSASIQDIVRRFKHDHADNWAAFPDSIAIQLNDTHPALGIPELMRILVDEEDVPWATAWDIAVRTFGYTNHTLLPEALEEWPVALLESLLPRHMEIIYQINLEFLQEVARHHPGDVERLRRMSIIGEDGVKRVRMAHLAVVASHKVNGVAGLHSQLMRDTIFREFNDLWPNKFTNKTNGVTPRRWLRKANPGLSGLITEAIGERWVKDLELLRELEPLADDPTFQQQWRQVKQACKAPLIKLVERETGVIITPDSLFDVQIKRIHEYKRQLLFALYIVAEYLRIKDNPDSASVPRTCLIGGKAAPGYYMAKLIIHLINRIADTVNRDPQVNDRLRVAFIPNYRVSVAEKIIPAANLSEQISTAGKEASGTGNMKLALNGALTIGTLDGANVEILGEVGWENIFIFGKTADEIMLLKEQGYDPRACLAASPMLRRVLHLLECDFFCPGEPGLFRPIYDALVYHDEYCLLADFDAYLARQADVTQAYQDQTRWTRMSILNVARCGLFSSDRTIREYAEEIWHAKPVVIPDEPSTSPRCPLHWKR
ncbi:MAG: glycogen/starch/alpha-glucan phosphorylase [Armatimonadota bacterium]